MSRNGGILVKVDYVNKAGICDTKPEPQKENITNHTQPPNRIRQNNSIVL